MVQPVTLKVCCVAERLVACLKQLFDTCVNGNNICGNNVNYFVVFHLQYEPYVYPGNDYDMHTGKLFLEVEFYLCVCLFTIISCSCECRHSAHGYFLIVGLKWVQHLLTS